MKSAPWMNNSTLRSNENNENVRELGEQKTHLKTIRMTEHDVCAYIAEVAA